MYIDSHCHLDFPAFDHDRSEVLANCRALGVECLLIPGVAPGQWSVLRECCERDRRLYFAVGIHPWWQADIASREPQQLAQQLQGYLDHPQCLAIGECGLDALRGPPMAQQEALLDWHLALAEQLAKPVIIHCVKAHNPLQRLLKKYPQVRGVVHAFSGSAALATSYWRRGFYLGIGGTVTYERARKTREAVACLPDEALLLETDAPDMPIAGRQGQRNSPEQLPAIALTVAQLRGCSPAHVRQVTLANFQRLFQCEL